MNHTAQIAAEAAREVANKCALHLPYIKEREIGKATAIIKTAIEEALTDVAIRHGKLQEEVLKLIEQHESICPLSRTGE